MKVKELERTVNVAWSPAGYHPILLAAGTAAQQLDASFNTSACLELYSLNLAEAGLDLELKCSVPSQNRFHKLVWGGDNDKSSAGVVVGGCDSGKLQIYSVSKVLAGEDALLSHQDRHTGPVRSLDFNCFQTNLLASGASESEIFIWDLNNTSTPMTPGAKAQPLEDVMSLAWNRQVQHILASTFATRCTVWDLRKNEPIIKLTDSNSRVRWKVVAWNPDVATQLCLASEEDSNPVVQLWDLRFATTPLKSLQSHSRGVLSLAWCSQDSDLLISSGKDNRIICWKPNSNHQTGEIQCEIGNTQQWIFELSWCPRNPNLIASCSADSHASIYNLTGASTQSHTTNKIADSFPGMEEMSEEPAAPQARSTVELIKPPKWMRRPGGANLSFGGKLVSFGGEGGTVTISQVLSDGEYVERARTVLDMLENGKAAELCVSRQDPLWSYLQATFSSSPHSAIKSLLGYSQVLKTGHDEDTEAEILNNGMAALTHEDAVHSNNIMDDPYSNNINGSEQFDALSSKTDVSSTKKTPKFILPTGSDAEGSICKSLLSGDLEEAVNRCLSEGRSADALVLATVAGSALLCKTQQKYFDAQNGSSHVEHLIRAIVTNDWHNFMASCELVCWKEALVALLTYSRQEQIPELCESLGKRLEESGKPELAVGADICYITAGSITNIISKKISESNLSSPAAIQEMVELVMVGEAAALSQGKQICNEGQISDLFTDYALMLASQGDFQTALAYLHHTQGEQVNDLRERLHANLGMKQDYQQQQQQSQYQAYRPQQTQTRKYSAPQQPVNNQFAKMSAMGAVRTNAAATTGVGMNAPANDFSHQQRPPSVPPLPSQSPGLSHHAGNVGKKYLVDPSVGGGDSGAAWGNKYYPTGPTRGMPQEMAPTPFQPPSGPFQSQNAPFQPPAAPFQAPTGPFQPQTTPFQPMSNTFQPPTDTPSMLNPMAQTSHPPPSKSQVQSVQGYHSGKPGWNDPPVLSPSSKSQNKAESSEVKAPITSPLAPPPQDAYSAGFSAPPGLPGVGGSVMRPPPPTAPFQPSHTQRFNPPGPPPTIGAGNTGVYGRPMVGAPPLAPQTAPSVQFGSPTAPPPPMLSSGIPQGQQPMGMAPPPTGPPHSSTPLGRGPMAPPPQPVTGVLPAPPLQHNAGMRPPYPGGAPSLGSGGFPPPPFPGPTPVQPGVAPHSALGPPPLGSENMTPSQGSPFHPPGVGQRPPSRTMSQTPTLPAHPPSAFQPPPSSSPAPQVNGGYGDPPSRGGHVGVLPENLKPVQSTLESLRVACYNASNNPQVKRKLEDVARKLELLYEALREARLSGETVNSLEEIIRESAGGNYTGALAVHTRMISGTDFSQISCFMPALKVLIQTAMQLNVYVQ